MSKFSSLFLLYLPQGIFKALWTILRILILPYKKLDLLIPQKGTILDIGCGNGGFTNFLSIKSSERVVLGIDHSRKRIKSANKTVGKRKNIKFILGDAITVKQPSANCYLIVDVLHHIDFRSQEKLLKFLTKKMGNNSMLIIKEVDPSDRIPFFFGHIIEKILYPKERIYARSKKDWGILFRSLGLVAQTIPGVFYFPDSTRIFVLKHKTSASTRI